MKYCKLNNIDLQENREPNCQVCKSIYPKLYKDYCPYVGYLDN